MNRTTRVTGLALIASMVLTLASCAHHDPAYEQLAARAETSPDPSAIVGMWHRVFYHQGTEYTTSLMFNGSGTGFSNTLGSDLLSHDEYNDEFNWSYAGAGVWKLQGYDGATANHDIKISGGKLLFRNSSGVWGTGTLVYDRVQM